MDNMAAVNMPLLTRVVLKSLRVLYLHERWEKLIDISLKFLAVTCDSNADIVYALIVHGQRQLINRIISNGGDPNNQPHLNVAIATSKTMVLTPWDYINMKMLLPHNASFAQLPMRTKALQLSSVPLNVKYWSGEFAKVINWTPPALKQFKFCRKLSALYHKGFVQETEVSNFCTFPSKDVESVDDQLESNNTCRINISQLISEYRKACSLLSVDACYNKLLAYSYYELGNHQMMSNDFAGAYESWQCALNALLHMTDALREWRVLSKDPLKYDIVLLKKFDAWGCVLGANITANISRHALAKNHDANINCCLLGVNFFKAILKTSLNHPLLDIEYSTFNIPTNSPYLVPGIDIFSIRLRCDAKVVFSSSLHIIATLNKFKYNLQALPVCAINEYIANKVCHNVKACIRSRLARIECLVGLQLFSEAMHLYSKIMLAVDIPQPMNNEYKLSEFSEENICLFDNCQPLTFHDNIQYINWFCSLQLSSLNREAYGNQLTCSLLLLRVQILTSIASCVMGVPNSSENAIGIKGGDKKVDSKDIKNMKNDGKFFGTSEKLQIQLENSSEVEKNNLNKYKEFIKMKEMLLSISTSILTSFTNIITTEFISADVVPNDLEFYLKILFEQARIAYLKHEPILSARYAYIILKNIQENDFLRSRMNYNGFRASLDEDIDSHLISLQNLDSVFWFKVMILLVESLSNVVAISKIPKVETLEGSEQVLSDVDIYLKEALQTSELFSNAEMQAQILFLGVKLHLKKAVPVVKTITILKEIIVILKSQCQLSADGELLLCEAKMHLCDIERMVDETYDVLTLYNQTHETLLNQASNYGIEDLFGTQGNTDNSKNNFNLYHSDLYATILKVRLRLGNLISCNTLKSLTNSNYTSFEAYNKCLLPQKFLLSSLQFSESIIHRDITQDVEILLNLGYIERQLVLLNSRDVNTSVNILIKAIENILFIDELQIKWIKNAISEIFIILLSKNGLLKLDGCYNLYLNEKNEIESSSVEINLMDYLLKALINFNEFGPKKIESPKDCLIGIPQFITFDILNSSFLSGYPCRYNKRDLPTLEEIIDLVKKQEQKIEISHILDYSNEVVRLSCLSSVNRIDQSEVNLDYCITNVPVFKSTRKFFSKNGISSVVFSEYLKDRKRQIDAFLCKYKNQSYFDSKNKLSNLLTEMAEQYPVDKGSSDATKMKNNAIEKEKEQISQMSTYIIDVEMFTSAAVSKMILCIFDSEVGIAVRLVDSTKMGEIISRLKTHIDEQEIISHQTGILKIDDSSKKEPKKTDKSLSSKATLEKDISNDQIDGKDQTDAINQTADMINNFIFNSNKCGQVGENKIELNLINLKNLLMMLESKVGCNIVDENLAKWIISSIK